ncbi:MAG: thioredoxin family protein [Candidatus Sumerlaeaceae bacterium]
MDTSLIRQIGICITAVALCGLGIAQDIIIEACQGGQNSSNYAEISGQWISSVDATTERSGAPGLTPAGTCMARKLNTGTAGEARFYPRFTNAGHYCVYVTWPRAANSKQVLYVTRCSGNQSAKSVIQNGVGYRNPANGSRWIYLGEWDFAAGGDDYIAVSANARDTTPNDPSKPGAVYADAVRFVLKPLTPADGAELFPRDRVEMRGLGASIPAGAAPLLNANVAAQPAGVLGSAPNAGASGSPSAAYSAPAAGLSAGAVPPGVDVSSGISWMSNLQQAQASAAADKQKRIVIYFHSGESQLCMKYDREVFTNPEVVKLIREKYFPVKLELEQAAEIATALGVFRGGTILVYDSAGNGLKKITESLEVPGMMQELRF